jgi:hypothetical protein
MYIGVDISEQAIGACRAKFANDRSKTFLVADEYNGQTGELALSLDVIYHLVEDDVFDEYMTRLFDAAQRYVIIYSSDVDQIEGDHDAHIKHRRFSDWIARRRPTWTRIAHIPNPHPYSGDPLTGTFADFYIFGQRGRSE